MPPHRKPRRMATLSGSFYDKSGSIAEGGGGCAPSPTAAAFPVDSNDTGMDSDSDDEYTLTGYGELSTDTPFMLPPSPTQTIKYRYRAYRPKLARLSKKYRAGAAVGGKTTSTAYHTSELYGSTRSPKRDFQALIHRYRDSAEGWRGDTPAYVSPRRTGSERMRPAASSPAAAAGTPMRRGGSRLAYSP